MAADSNSSNDSAAMTVTMRVRDIFPPARITDLEAAASVAEEGNVLLMWTAPDEDNLPQPSNDPVKEYFVRYATFSVSDLAENTTTWWDHATDAVGEPFPPQHRGHPEAFSLTYLEPGATIYFAIKSRDEKDNTSIIDTLSETGPQSFAHVLDLPPAKVTGLILDTSLSSITLSWSPSTSTDVMSYRIYWDTSAPADVYAATVTVSVEITSYTFTNLVGQNSYYFYVTALDKGATSYLGEVLESTPSAVVSDFPKETVPIVPSNMSGISITSNSITWQWLDNSTNETGFRIYSSTGGIIGVVNSSLETGTTAQFIETNLTLNTTYSRFVKAYNLAGESLGSNTTARYTLSNPPVNTMVMNSYVSDITIFWSANDNPSATVYEAQISTDSGFNITSTVNTASFATIFRNLISNTTYYLRVRSQNGEGVKSNFDTTVTTTTLPVSVQGLVAIPGNKKITLDWQDSTESDLAGYFVYRTTNSADTFTRINLAPLTTSYYVDQSLINGVTYYYKVTLITSSGRESIFSNTVFAKPKKAGKPQEPRRIQGTLDSQAKFILKWNPVTLDEEGSVAELAGYRIYKSTAVEGPFNLRDLASPTTNLWVSPDLVPPVVWYFVRALDTSDNESADSIYIQSSNSPDVAVASLDKTVHMLFPAEEAKFFNADTNNLSEDVRLMIDRRSEQEQGNVLTSYEIKAFGTISGTEIKDLKFTKPAVRLQFRYQQGISGAPLPAKAALRTFDGSPKDVGIFWHNGVEYVKFGGVVDEIKGTVSIRSAKLFGKFQVKHILRATEFTLNQLTPRKTFTPNGDGVNDEIYLFVENPKESMITQAKIYDITGAEVADFQQGIVANSQGIISLKWDGRDKDGEVVRSGIYIYQVQCEGKVINGTIVVAR